MMQIMNKPGEEVSDPKSCCFEELRIRARSSWHRERYNHYLEAAKQNGLSGDEARASAIKSMQPAMGE